VRNEAKLLTEALLSKERNQELLANLEKLKVGGSIAEQKYALLKSDYQRKITAAVSEIARLKSRLKLKLDEAKNRLNLMHVELEELRARHDAGELSISKYQRAERKLLKQIANTKKDVIALQSLVEAKTSSQLVTPKVAFPRWVLSAAVSAAAVILCAVLFTGWWLWLRPWPFTAQPPIPPPAEQVTAPSAWAEPVAHVQPTVVEVKADGTVGSGVIIDKADYIYILTAVDNVKGKKQVTIKLYSREEYPAKVVKEDDSLAVIRIASDNVTASIAELGDSDTLKPGEEVASIGYALDTPASINNADGKVIDIKEGIVHTDIPFDISRVGGALINAKGKLVGIVIERPGKGETKNTTFAVAINKAKPLIEQAKAKQEQQE